jgi:hypothetical protein
VFSRKAKERLRSGKVPPIAGQFVEERWTAKSKGGREESHKGERGVMGRGRGAQQSADGRDCQSLANEAEKRACGAHSVDALLTR